MKEQKREQECIEDEINLRNYIEVIVRRKRIILAVFFIAVVTATVVSSLMPRVYQATTSLMITPPRLPTVSGVTPIPTIPVPTHQALLESSTILGRIIDRLELTDRLGKTLTTNDLKILLNVEEVRGTNILRLKVKEHQSRRAKEIANAWAEEYLKYSHKFISGGVMGVGDFAVSQFELTREDLLRAEGAVKDFRDKHKVELMLAELDIKKEKLESEKREHLGLSLALKTKEASLRELEEQMAGQEKFIVVSKAITDKALWERGVKGKGLDDLGDRILKSEEINPLYQSLRARIVDTEMGLNIMRSRLKYLEESLQLTKKEIDKLEKIANQRKFELTQLTRQATIYGRILDGLVPMLIETRLSRAMELGEIRIVSPAVEPERPIRPRKGQIVAISGILSLMFGTFLAFFMEYWKSSKKET